jgi:hypothetical protein
MKILVPLLTLLLAMPSWAARQFDVEVIIFKRNVDAEKTAESWPESLPPISYRSSGSLQSSSYLDAKGVSLLPHSMYQLNSQEKRLRNHAGFQVLLHTAWRQGDKGQSRAPTFHLVAGKNFSTLYNEDGSRIASSPNGLTAVSPLMEFEGKLQIYVQHYLFANAEFNLKEPTTRKVSVADAIAHYDQSATPTAVTQLGNLQAIQTAERTEHFLKTYRLDQKRKMRSGEIHYFDHPLMGMIVQVRKAN